MNRNQILLGAAAIGAGAAAVSLFKKKDEETALANQVVLITGGSRGLGLAMAREFGAHDCRLAICARDTNELEAARASMSDIGIEVFATRCDVTDREQVRDMIRSVRSHYGRIDILVNNAGIIRVAPVENMTIKDFEDAMSVMFWGVVYPTLEVLEEMKERRAGRIVTITSIGGKVSVPHLLPYCCAKFAAVGFCEGLQAELQRSGVTVSTVVPGLMRTGSHRKAQFKGRHQQEAAWFTLGATLPITAMSADLAARKIVDGVRRGDVEIILSTQAHVMSRLNGAFPGLVPQLLGMVNRLLPRHTSDTESIVTGAQVTDQGGMLLRLLSLFGQHAARQYNEHFEPAR